MGNALRCNSKQCALTCARCSKRLGNYGALIAIRNNSDIDMTQRNKCDARLGLGGNRHHADMCSAPCNRFSLKLFAGHIFASVSRGNNALRARCAVRFTPSSETLGSVGVAISRKGVRSIWGDWECQGPTSLSHGQNSQGDSYQQDFAHQTCAKLRNENPNQRDRQQLLNGHNIYLHRDVSRHSRGGYQYHFRVC